MGKIKFIREKIHFYLSDNTNKISIGINRFINVLILLSVLDFSMQTVPTWTRFHPSLANFEYIVFVFFSIEYFLRVFSAPKPFKFIFSFFGLVDLITITPSLLGLAYDIRTLRVLRLLRVFKNYEATKNLRKSFIDVKSELGFFSLATLFLLFIAGTGIYHFEHEAQPEAFASIFDSIWWAVATLTTVGYGDIYPITVGGKVFSTIIVFLGLGLVTVPTALIASSFTAAFAKKKEDE